MCRFCYVLQKKYSFSFFGPYWALQREFIVFSAKNFKKRLSSASSACETKNFFIFEKSKMRRYHFIPQVLKSELKPWRTRAPKKVAKRGGGKAHHFRTRPHHLWVESHIVGGGSRLRNLPFFFFSFAFLFFKGELVSRPNFVEEKVMKMDKK